MTTDDAKCSNHQSFDGQLMKSHTCQPFECFIFRGLRVASVINTFHYLLLHLKCLRTVWNALYEARLQIRKTLIQKCHFNCFVALTAEYPSELDRREFLQDSHALSPVNLQRKSRDGIVCANNDLLFALGRHSSDTFSCQ